MKHFYTLAPDGVIHRHPSMYMQTMHTSCSGHTLLSRKEVNRLIRKDNRNGCVFDSQKQVFVHL